MLGRGGRVGGIHLDAASNSADLYGRGGRVGGIHTLTSFIIMIIIKAG